MAGTMIARSYGMKLDGLGADEAQLTFRWQIVVVVIFL